MSLTKMMSSPVSTWTDASVLIFALVVFGFRKRNDRHHVARVAGE